MRTPLFERIEMGGDSSRLSSVIFVLLLAVPMLSSVLYGGVDTGTWSVLSLLIGAIAVLWLIDGWRGRALLINPDALLIPLAGVILLGVIQLVAGASLDPYTTRLFLIRLTAYAVFLGAALTFLNTARRLRLASAGIVLFGSVMGFFGILQRLASSEAIYGIRPPGQAVPFGPYINQHHFAAFMEMVGAIAIALLFSRTLGRDKKLLIGTGLLFIAVAVILTGSRGGLLSFIAAAAFVIAASRLGRGRKSEARAGSFRRLPIVLASVCALFLFLGFILFIGGDEAMLRSLGIAEVGDDVSNGRLHFWSIALTVFLSSPVIGIGLESFGTAFSRYDTWAGTFRLEYAHNEYLQMLADGGIIGFACVAAFLFLLFKKSLSAISSIEDDFRLRLAIGAAGGCLAIAIHSFFDFPLRTPANAFFFLLLCVISTARVPNAESATSP